MVSNVTPPQFPTNNTPHIPIEHKPAENQLVVTNNNAVGNTSAPNQSAPRESPSANNTAGGSTSAPKQSATGVKSELNNAGDTVSISKNAKKNTKNGGKNNVITQKVENFFKGAVKKIAKLPTNRFVWGATGVLGASAAIYGIAKDGTAKGLRDARQEEGGFYQKLFSNTSSSEFYSHLLEDVKDETHQTLFDHWIFPAFSKIKHVTKSLALETVRNIDTIAAAGAALGALFIKTDKIAIVNGIEKKIPVRGNKIAQTIIGTAGAGYLLFKGGYTFIRDVLGFGKT